MTTQAIRRTALRLAQLHSDDRNWILSNLPEEHRISVFQEMQSLSGIPVDVLRDAGVRIAGNGGNKSGVKAGSTLPGAWQRFMADAHTSAFGNPSKLVETLQQQESASAQAPRSFLSMLQSRETSGDPA